MRVVVLTTEEEGVAFACGAALGGERAALPARDGVFLKNRFRAVLGLPTT